MMYYKSSATGLTWLHRRAPDRSITAINATVTGQWLNTCFAIGAFIKIQAGINGHGFLLPARTNRTGNDWFKYHRIFHWMILHYFSEIVKLLPHFTGVAASDGFVFQRHSRTVIIFRMLSIVTNWKLSLVSSFAETLPFMGESTLKTGRLISLSGPW